ncbi:MAG TPA: hypothetical protein VFA60_14170 [Terriglobales bacterium]|nr:hypothetical protein [Terriglobales bacterium]
MPSRVNLENANVDALCALTLGPARSGAALEHVASLDPAERDALLSLADSNHVVLRSLAPVLRYAADRGDADLGAWAAKATVRERGRIANALKFLAEITRELETAGCPVTVIKTLEHWPDLGNDLDLYSTADERAVVKVMTSRLHARVEPRSWGDRLAQKWNFAIPGLAELVEVHVQRLGQTGEHIAMAKRFVTRRRPRAVNGYTFQVPAPEEAVIVATLQRMYRHFYFRVCDMVNTAALMESGALDYAELKRAADVGGVWPGVATYLTVVSDYAGRYRGAPVAMPAEVRAAAAFGGDKIFVRARFLRVPVMPEGAGLYTRQVTTTALRGDVPAMFRLTLLPPLASAAAIACRITGSDKGIW